MSVHGTPAYLHSTSDPEFVNQAILNWLAEARIGPRSSTPASLGGTAPTSRSTAVRDECLSVEWLRTRREVQVIIEAWRQHYNAVRPHSSLGYLTLREFKRHDPPVSVQPNRATSRNERLEVPDSGHLDDGQTRAIRRPTHLRTTREVADDYRPTSANNGWPHSCGQAPRFSDPSLNVYKFCQSLEISLCHIHCTI